ncbi:MAG: transporter substrate-binding domain-containing protein [Gemmatimonadota bacterium]
MRRSIRTVVPVPTIPLTLLASALLAVLVGTSAPVAAAQEVVVGTRVAPPFVIEQGEGEYTGLAIHLWEHIADELDLDYRFEERDIQGLLEGVEDGSLYAGAAALTITSAREARVDFTHPFAVDGLGIAVPHSGVGLLGAMFGLFSRDFLAVVGLLLGLLLVWGVLIWLFERRRNPEEFGGSALEGIGSGFWWAAVTMTTVGYGDKAPRTPAGRTVGFVWMFGAIVVISFFTAAIASSLTVDRLDSRVSGPQDLPFVRVGALEGSAGFAYLEADGIRAEPYPSISEGLNAVAEGELDAFVHDAPILRYFVQEEFRNRARILPVTFAQQYYGIALPRDAGQRNAINQVLLDYLASDEWTRLNRRYLGEEG